MGDAILDQTFMQIKSSRIQLHLVLYLRVVTMTFKNYPRNDEFLLLLREKVAAAIESYL